MENQLLDYVWGLLLRSPVFLVTIGGIVWAIVQWRKAPNAALFATLACSVLLVASCVFPALFTWLVPALGRHGQGGSIVWVSRTVLATWNACTAVCLAALVFAVFAGRAAAVRRADDERWRRMGDDYDVPPPRPGGADRGMDDRIQ